MNYQMQVLGALFGVIGVLCALLFFRWVYNKRKFNKLAHQIPAAVVKNYLDSIIQNSSSLKSSLFRGELGVGEGIPSVMPVGDISGGSNVEVDSALREQLNQKNAEISALKAKVSEKDNQLSELDQQINMLKSNSGGGGGDNSAELAKIAELEAEIARLKAELEAAKANAGGGGGDAAVQAQLDEVTKERDELKDKLQEYEIIEDDLANLKRLQQENAELKAALEKGGGAPPAAAPAEEAPAEEPAPEPEVNTAEEAPTADPQPIEEAGAEEAAPAEPAPSQEEIEEGADPKLQGEEKSAEDLLSEFEKMLG